MKVSVLTARGQILATSWIEDASDDRSDYGRGGLLAGDGQKLQQVEVPADLREVRSAEELHERLKKLMSRKAS